MHRIEDSNLEDEEGLPEDFICPISNNPMTHPVTLCGCGCGYSYEESDITSWLEKNNTCPMSRCELTTKNFVPNRPLKSGIEFFRASQKKKNEDVQ
jgi:hypothetical protein